MDIIEFSAADFLRLGLELAGFSEHRQHRTTYVTNLRRFRAHFYASPASCAGTFSDLQTNNIAEACIDGKPSPIYLLMALNWLKQYSVEEELAGRFKLVEKTARKWTQLYTQKVQALKAAKVSTATTTHKYFEYTNLFLFCVLLDRLAMGQ
jgi:hypothetical protein